MLETQHPTAYTPRPWNRRDGSWREKDPAVPSRDLISAPGNGLPNWEPRSVQD
jgi:hypothetical protein